MSWSHLVFLKPRASQKASVVLSHCVDGQSGCLDCSALPNSQQDVKQALDGVEAAQLSPQRIIYQLFWESEWRIFF